jgi:hypothetical protein
MARQAHKNVDDFPLTTYLGHGITAYEEKK